MDFWAGSLSHMNQFKSKRKHFLMKIKKLYYPLLLVLPVMMALAAVLLKDARGPYWLGSNSDPEYVYLLNAANLAGLKGVGHIDHPGTPVQVLGAVTIRVVHFFNFSPGIDWHTDVLRRPEYYLKAINIVMIVLNVLMLLTLGMFTYFLAKNFWLSIWLQLSPFFSITLLEFGLPRVTPEPLLFFSSSLMMAVLVFVLIHPGHLTTPGKKVIMIFIFGVIIGFGTACKITFIPLVVIPLILLSKIKNKILFLFAAVISFVIFTLPIIRMYPRFFDWIFNLFTHSGHYGGGAAKLVSTQKYFKNIKILLAGNPFFSIILVLALAIVVITVLVPRLRQTHCAAIHFKLLAAVAAAQVTGLLMVAKHSAHHYLLPVLNLSGMAFFLIFLYFKRNGRIKEAPTYHTPGEGRGEPCVHPASPGRSLGAQPGMITKIFTISMVIFLVILFVLANPVGQWNKTITRLKNLKQQSLAVHQEVINNYKGYVKIFYYGSSSPEYALKFGNDLSRSYHSQLLEKLYKNVYFYDTWTKRFAGFDYNRTIPFATIREKHGNKIIFQGPKKIKVPGVQLNMVPGPGFREGIFLVE
jgi:hypothetical protein